MLVVFATKPVDKEEYNERKSIDLFKSRIVSTADKIFSVSLAFILIFLGKATELIANNA